MTGLVDAVNDGVITIDAEGKVVLFNRAAERLFGAPATEAIGGSVERFIPRHPRTPEAARTPASCRSATSTAARCASCSAARRRPGVPARGLPLPPRDRARAAPDRGPARRDRPADGPRRAAGARGAGGVEPGQDRVPVAHEPRAAHAAERRPRLLPAASARHRRAAVAAAARPHPAHRERRRAPAGAGQRRARPVARRVGADDGHARIGGPSLLGRGCADDGGAAGRQRRRQDLDLGARGRLRIARRGRRRRHLRPRRPCPPAPGAGQPAQQCRQVQPAGRPGAGELAGRRTIAAPCASPTTASA